MSVMLAKKFTGQNVLGWHMSEKLDGVRAIWTGRELISRNNKVFHAPEWFVSQLPKNVVLDGELFECSGGFQKTVGRVRAHAGDWSNVRFMIFDTINDDVFEQRYHALRSLELPVHCEIVKQVRCDSQQALDDFESKVLALGGEGVMLKKPRSLYEAKRSSALLKVKRFDADEAEVIDHEAGLGKHAGRLGALVCRYKDTIFNVGTGMTDEQRERPPSVGSLITFSFFGLTDGGVPRHPSFIAERNYE